jgi:peptidoglycan/xylan/chitin deacetylase (PgdA/CDA1 family)
LPILKKYNVPATIFLPTDYIGTENWFWPERVLYLLTRTNGQETEKDINLETKEVVNLFHSDSIRNEEKINKVIEFLKKKPLGTIEGVIEDLKTLTGSREFPNKRLILNWEEIRKMGKDNIAFGSHTRTHAILTMLTDPKQIQSELINSKNVIENKTAKPVRSFCFPNGDSNTELIRMVKESGYECAFVGGRGTVRKGSNPFELKRIGIHNDVSWNIPLFDCRIVFGFF